MAENVIYADLNLPEPTGSRILTLPDVQGSGCTYADVKVKAQDTNATANCKSAGKSRCSRKHVTILVVIILVLVLAVYLVITYGLTANSQQDSTTIPEEALGCPPPWKKHGRKCYFFSPEAKSKDWNASRAECTAMGSDLVVIDSREELVRSSSWGSCLGGLELPGQGLSSDTSASSCHMSLGSGTCCHPRTPQPWQWEQSPAQGEASWGLESCPWKLLCPGLIPWQGANSLPSWLGFYRHLAHRPWRLDRRFFVRAMAVTKPEKALPPPSEGKSDLSHQITPV
ncbi:uncharacterized protein LOC120501623 isoform X1 [Passer montanus]|uniref:uncharacterized protein LOC120501623 isoform X1 n=1 Tax=Passer montanus TaxID=9160 RepID=UPI00195F61F9|nr:uncharacterized protein LOC120501623 isoform X1 [Passer montanus]